MSDSLWSLIHGVAKSWTSPGDFHFTSLCYPHGLQNARLLYPSLFPGVCSNSCLLSWWCYLTISSSVPFSPFAFNLSHHQGFFPVSKLFTSSGQIIWASVSASVLAKSIQGWFPLGLTGLISLLSNGLLRVFSTTVWKHQFFVTQPFLQSNSYICKWLLEKP